MMKILCAVASLLVAATVHAVPEPVPELAPTPASAPVSASASAPASTGLAPAFATWHMADLHDVTQAWYFTGEALGGHGRDGVPWAGDRPFISPADAALALPAPSAAPVARPSAIPEARMSSMLLVGLVLIFLRTTHKEEVFA